MSRREELTFSKETLDALEPNSTAIKSSRILCRTSTELSWGKFGRFRVREDDDIPMNWMIRTVQAAFENPQIDKLIVQFSDNETFEFKRENVETDGDSQA